MLRSSRMTKQEEVPTTPKECAHCKKEAKWLSVNQLCWSCLKEDLKSKPRLHLLPEDRQPEIDEFESN